PGDMWKEIAYCTNHLAIEADCEYPESHGFSSSVSNSVSHSIELGLGLELEYLFVTTEGAGSGHFSSGYNWTNSHYLFTTTMTEMVKGHYPVPAHKTINVLQIQGECADNKVHTQIFAFGQSDA
ncbi:unnamed protein product, partial [Meganyctiphanes norvegica]